MEHAVVRKCLVFEGNVMGVFDDIRYVPSAKVFVVRTNEQYGMYSLYGKELLPVKYDEIFVPDDYVRFVENGKMGLCSTNGKILIQPLYQIVRLNDDGLAIVTDGEHAGAYHAATGEVCIDVVYDNLKFPENTPFIVLCLGGKFGVYFKNSGATVNPMFDSFSYTNNRIALQSARERFIYDEVGNRIA